MSHPAQAWPYMGHSKYQLCDHGILDSFYIFGESEDHVDLSANSGRGQDLFVHVPKEFAQKVIECRNRHIEELTALFREEQARLEGDK